MLIAASIFPGVRQTYWRLINGRIKGTQTADFVQGIQTSSSEINIRRLDTREVLTHIMICRQHVTEASQYKLPTYDQRCSSREGGRQGTRSLLLYVAKLNRHTEGPRFSGVFTRHPQSMMYGIAKRQSAHRVSCRPEPASPPLSPPPDDFPPWPVAAEVPEPRGTPPRPAAPLRWG